MAKKFLIFVGSIAFVLFFWNALTAPPSLDETYQTPVDSSIEVEKTPEVAAPIARPFALPVEGAADDTEGGGFDALDDEGSSESDEDADSTEKLQKSESYQSAVALAQKFVAAYGTYSPEQSAQEWADALPSLDDEARASLLKSAEAVWPEIEDRKATSVASPVAQSVKPVFSRQEGQVIQLSVSAAKKTSYEGADGYGSQSYAVTLERKSGTTAGWTITAVS